MTTVKIDDKEYDFHAMSAAAKDQLLSIQFVDAEITRQSGMLAVLQTARAAYIKALRENLDDATQDPMAGDTIRLN